MRRASGPPSPPGRTPSSPPNRVDYRNSIYHNPIVSPSPKPLPASSLHIVLALLDGELHGYALMRRVAELSDGAVKMGPGTLYGTLNRLVAEGLIVETTDRDDRSESERRRYYELTPTGLAVARTELDRLRTLLRRVGRSLLGGTTA